MKLTINPSRDSKADLNLLPLFAAVSAEGWLPSSKIIVADVRGNCPDIDAGQNAANAHNLAALNRALALTDFRLTSEELDDEARRDMLKNDNLNNKGVIAKRLSKEVYAEYVAELGAYLGLDKNDLVVSGNHRALVAILYHIANGKFPAGMSAERLPGHLTEREFYQANFRLNDRNDTTTAIATSARYLQAVKCLPENAWTLTEQELGEAIYGKVKWCDDSTRDAVQRMRRMLQVNHHCRIVLPLDRVPSIHRKNYPIPQEQKADGTLGYSSRAALDKTLTVEAFAAKMDAESQQDEKAEHRAERILKSLREGAASITSATPAAATPAAATPAAATEVTQGDVAELPVASVVWTVEKLAQQVSAAIKGGLSKEQLREAFTIAWSESEQGKAEAKAEDDVAKAEAEAHKKAKGHKKH